MIVNHSFGKLDFIFLKLMNSKILQLKKHLVFIEKKKRIWIITRAVNNYLTYLYSIIE